MADPTASEVVEDTNTWPYHREVLLRIELGLPTEDADGRSFPPQERSEIELDALRRARDAEDRARDAEFDARSAERRQLLAEAEAGIARVDAILAHAECRPRGFIGSFLDYVWPF